MRTSFMRFMLCAVVAVAFTACDKEIYNENGMSPDGTTADGAVPEGYFRATFFPEQGGDASTRAVVEGESKAIQSLICIIYQKQDDGSFRYLQEMPVLTYNGPVASEGQEIQPKEYLWPLKNEVTFLLPKGKEYRAVFVGNSDKNLFEGQDGQLLSDYKQRKYDEARLCMPDKGPVAFNNYNMFYLCTVDFNEEDFAEGGTPPHVLMQRVVSNNIYGRRMINTEDDVNDVVNVLVDELVKNDNLLATTLETLLIKNLKANLGDWIDENKSLNIFDPNNAIARTLEGLINVAGGLDKFVSLLLTTGTDENPDGILGTLLDEIRIILLDRLTTQLGNAILGSTDDSLLGLGHVLSPWEHVTSVDITYTSLPKNINFDRECTLSEDNAGPYNYVLGDMTIEKPGKKPNDPVKKETYRTFNVITFCGEQNVDKITVNSEGLVGSLLDALDNGLLDGLLINIKDADPPLIYEAESNREYRTFYDLVNLALNKIEVVEGENDNNNHEGMDLVELKINLTGAINFSKILGAVLGKLGEWTGGVLDTVLGIVTTILDNIIGNNGIKIYLPKLLDINSIKFDGQWGETVISYSDETIHHTNQ